MTLERGMQIAQGLSSAGNSIQNTLHQANAEKRRQKKWEWKKDEHETNEQTDKLTNKLTSEIQSKMEETGDPTTGLQAAQKLTDKWAENEEYDPSAIRKARANAFTNVSNQLNFNSKAIQYKSQKLEQERQELTQKLSGSMSAIQDGNYSDNDIQNVLQVATKAPNDKDYRLKDGVVYEKGVNADWSNSEEVNKTPVSEFNLEKVSQNLSAQLHPETYTKKKLQAEFATRETNAENQKNPYVLKNPDTGDTIYYAPQQDPYSQEHSGLIADNSALNNAKGLKETNKDLSNYKRLGRIEDLESGDVSGDSEDISGGLSDTEYKNVDDALEQAWGKENMGLQEQAAYRQKKMDARSYVTKYKQSNPDTSIGEATDNAIRKFNNFELRAKQLAQNPNRKDAAQFYRDFADIMEIKGIDPETFFKDKIGLSLKQKKEKTEQSPGQSTEQSSNTSSTEIKKTNSEQRKDRETSLGKAGVNYEGKGLSADEAAQNVGYGLNKAKEWFFEKPKK